MAIHVKAHRRGKSVVKAYKRNTGRLMAQLQIKSSGGRINKSLIRRATLVRSAALKEIESKYYTALKKGASPKRLKMFSNTDIQRMLIQRS